MAPFSQKSETYRRRLRLSSRDVLVAIALTLLVGAVMATAFWKRPASGSHAAGALQLERGP